MITTIKGTPVSAASMIASAANGGGTKTTLALAPVDFTASETVLNSGTFCSKSPPPFPGTTPATTCVPYSIICRAWKDPVEPVMPCTSTRVWLSTKMLMRPLAPQRPLSPRHRADFRRG